MNANDFENIKVALVHDFLNQYGGAERVLEALAELFPDAPIYTLLHDPDAMRGKFADRKIHTSFLQKLPRWVRKHRKWLFPLMPTAPETFNLRDFDIVISSSSTYAKGIILKPKTVHVSYCHSPMRYVWDWKDEYLDEQALGKRKKFVTRLLLNYVRIWDRAAADRVDFFLANSKTTQRRIKKYYGSESEVIFPPVDMTEADRSLRKNSYHGFAPGEYFLVVSRLSPYKKVELAIDALRKFNFPLIIVGTGSGKYEKKLLSLAGQNVKFAGWVDDKLLKNYYADARAVIFPGEDDWGIVPVEAMAQGKPVIALRKGGATETIIEGETGIFFGEPQLESLADGVRRFIEMEKSFDPEKIRQHAQQFSKEKFLEAMRSKTLEYYEKYQEDMKNCGRG